MPNKSILDYYKADDGKLEITAKEITGLEKLGVSITDIETHNLTVNTSAEFNGAVEFDSLPSGILPAFDVTDVDKVLTVDIDENDNAVLVWKAIP